jgi:hypothetical protein
MPNTQNKADVVPSVRELATITIVPPDTEPRLGTADKVEICGKYVN